MLSQTETHRLTAAINALRPDWPLASLSSWIRNNLADRAYRDAAVALAWVATDPETTTPGRVLEAGPWWRAVMADKGTVSTITHRCPEHPAERAWDCKPCAEQAIPATEGAATVRAALAHAPRPPAPRTPAHPTPVHDLDDTRRRADRDQEQTS
jgi:hypothetical protein